MRFKIIYICSSAFSAWSVYLTLIVLCIEKLLLYKKSIDQNCFGFSNSSQYAHADINLILTIYGNKRISYLYT